MSPPRSSAPAGGDRSARLRRALSTGLFVAGLALLSAPVAAHGGSLDFSSDSVTVPDWLFLLTGGGVVAASFLLTSFLTARDILSAYHEWRRGLGLEAVRGGLHRVGQAIGLLGLAAVIVVGFFGPGTDVPGVNFAVLVVWVGWWAGYVMSVYLIGNSWPSVDPVRTLASALPADGPYALPDGLNAWPAVAGLMALVWLEVVSPLTAQPRLLATVVLAYVLVSLAGASLVGVDPWFDRVDPVSKVFAVYGRVAPVQRTEDGLRLVVPGAALVERMGESDGPGVVDGMDDVGFVIGLLWVTSFDGFVGTPVWRAVVTPVVNAGVPPRLAYLAAMLVGFGTFYGVYRLASRRVRESGDTYYTARAMARRFAPALLPIAAGYHLAHYLGYFVRLSPSLIAVGTQPLRIPAIGMVPPRLPPVVQLPPAFGLVGPLAVLAGHVLAVWVAHSIAFDTFTGKLQPIRSQYPYVIVMVVYTMFSLWLLAQPGIETPFV